MDGKVSDKAWDVQDGLEMPINMSSSNFSQFSRATCDIKNGDIQAYPYPAAERVAKLEVL